jgi:glyoxylase-like metal-dependent hydrolase (beta-lactamase superfamily II)
VDARIENVVTSGTCTLDDTEYDVENNTWIVGDDDEVIVIDPAHDSEAILKQVGERMILAVICTHGHEDHLSAALEVAEADEDDPAPIALHPRDRKLWRTYFSGLDQKDVPDPDIEMDDGGVFEVGGVQLEVIHTPGHTAGSVCLYSDQLGALFSGDTLHKGKPGEVGGVYPDITSQLNSIGALLGPLPKDARVLPGHGEETTIGDEDAHWESWLSLARDAVNSDDAENKAMVFTTVVKPKSGVDADNEDSGEDDGEDNGEDDADTKAADADSDSADKDDDADDGDEKDSGDAEVSDADTDKEKA